MNQKLTGRTAPLIETAGIRVRNCARILGHLRGGGEFNCRELSVRSELSVPTVSTIVSRLVSEHLLETARPRENTSGRPGKTFRIAGEPSVVMCVIIGTGTCSYVAISPAGQVIEETQHVFPTPSDTDRLIAEITRGASRLQERLHGRLLGIGVVLPGLLDAGREVVRVSANLSFLSGFNLRAPIAQSTQLPVVLVPAMEAHHWAESAFGPACGETDFVVLNFAGGIGLSVCMNGELVRGRMGSGIELGHIPFDLNGPGCGCGNRGCLEQFGSDQTIVQVGREAWGRDASIQEIVRACQSGALEITSALHAATDALAIAVATAINLFSPRKVLLFGYFLFAADDLLDRLQSEVARRALKTRMSDCEIFPAVADAHRSQQLGASVAVINQLAHDAVLGTS